ncbi:hypothetical protein GOQ27_08295 [Clostridium sp. D2Q-11]|uniref:Transposase DDE domain-containing protein n=1 Tax=Anaeromonas frigoriresistens TaxID=2683708 RepID=A0A942Z7A2_9FIRM|nr:transposase [Anaeromonas frigoriresistens]MBS4538462.1 hypothetical protein [Anaeromonas frigoriresistens]
MANEINPFLSSILITDITGFEPYVTKNNPKFFQQKLKKAKAYAKKTNINGKTTYLLSCNNPCTDSKRGRIKNLTVNHNYSFNTSMPKDSLKWISLFKIRTRVEKTIAQLKNFIQINSFKVKNTKSLKSEIILACIT